MDLNSHVRTAWQQTLHHLVPLVFLTLVLIGVSVLTLGILAPAAAAGTMQSLLAMLRHGREPRLRDVFSEMRLILPLLAFSVAMALLAALGYALWVVPGILVTRTISSHTSSASRTSSRHWR